ncbi:MAG: Cell division ATP-binding protein FtsE [Candidatus Wolfebacteria bacterium GW2011_GWC1_43_10]|uniref:Cell division ATP-binding protein FtsE n=2 Tax=Candidatus Wolfeibacteriota TaxID=1752735 RepID=A0A0G1F5U5_9BACT|nr:MAG: Cell division ATP-binding protein FtsE [Candidatus Wolfebacteria bacterium GW2011_GWC1_43_10]KKT22573.1 MAG: Cell division ATP-binding protein FtsE [Parcubacteria group bacterium GW2011_GWB1_43_8b]OGM89867.1 MAG: cell division ATP-binding protein FtsE [Candidatus Wolfebacteria bacterium GWA1_42_9]
MIIFQGVSKSYKSNSHTVIALDNVSFKINPKEFVSLVGRSGAGKSTIIKLLIGEERPTKGRIVFGSWDVNRLKQNELYRMRRHIGTVFQDFKLLPDKTAAENVAFALEAAGRPEEEIEELVPKVLEMVGILSKANQFPRELSGGEKQRVAIARAMINNPDVIIADEPTGNLDPINSNEIIKLLLKINELGTTVILASHNKDVVNGVNKRVISLEEGQIVRDEEEGKYILF